MQRQILPPSNVVGIWFGFSIEELRIGILGNLKHVADKLLHTYYYLAIFYDLKILTLAQININISTFLFCLLLALPSPSRYVHCPRVAFVLLCVRVGLWKALVTSNIKLIYFKFWEINGLKLKLPGGLIGHSTYFLSYFPLQVTLEIEGSNPDWIFFFF